MIPLEDTSSIASVQIILEYIAQPTNICKSSVQLKSTKVLRKKVTSYKVSLVVLETQHATLRHECS